MIGADFGFVVGGGLLLFGAPLVLLHPARRHRARLARWARGYGWTLVPRPVVDWGARLPGGNKHGVSLALHGRVGDRPVSLGEYSFTETVTMSGAGTTATSHQYVVVVLHLDRPSGYLGVQSRDVLARWGRTLFGGGVPVGDDRFDDRLRVVGDRAAAAYPLTAELIDAHAAGTVPPWILDGAELMTWYPGVIEPAGVADLIAPLHRVAVLLTAVDAAG